MSGTDARAAAATRGSLIERLRSQLGGGAGEMADLVGAIDRFTADGVMVVSLSNLPGESRVPLLAGLPLVDGRYTRGWIVAATGSVVAPRDPVTGLARRDAAGRVLIQRVDLASQPCGPMAFTCLVAETPGIVADTPTPFSEQRVAGTSFAAPQISGALAVLAEAFPGTHMHDLRRRLLASANDGFFDPDGTVDFGGGIVKGYSDRFGHGVIDLRAALMPIGRLGFAAADMAGPVPEAAGAGAPAAGAAARARPAPGGLYAAPPERMPIEAARMVAGRGMGDALARGLGGVAFVVRDDLGGAFGLPGEALVARPARRGDGGAAGAALGRFLAGPAAGAGAMPARDLDRAIAGGSGGWGGVAGTGGTAVAALFRDGVAVAAPVDDAGDLRLYAAHDPGTGSAAIGINRRLDLGDAAAVTLGASAIDERDSVLGLRAASGATRGRSGTVSMAAAADVGRWFGGAPGGVGIALAAEVGMAEPSRLGGVGETERAVFSSLGAELGLGSVLRDGDRVGLSASQPMRVEEGRLMLALPSEAGPGGLAVPLAPSGRQIDLAISYRAAFGARDGAGPIGLEMGALLSLDEGHVRGARGAGGYAGVSVRF
jgi:subtilase-type serine protease